MANYPTDLRYHSEHDWARVQGDEATFGITWYAQETLQEVVYFDPPGVGTKVTRDQPYAQLESVKTVSDLYRPCPARSSESTTRSTARPRQ